MAVSADADHLIIMALTAFSLFQENTRAWASFWVSLCPTPTFLFPHSEFPNSKNTSWRVYWSKRALHPLCFQIIPTNTHYGAWRVFYLDDVFLDTLFLGWIGVMTALTAFWGMP